MTDLSTLNTIEPSRSSFSVPEFFSVQAESMIAEAKIKQSL
jgi:hypothetical protein